MCDMEGAHTSQSVAWVPCQGRSELQRFCGSSQFAGTLLLSLSILSFFSGFLHLRSSYVTGTFIQNHFYIKS